MSKGSPILSTRVPADLLVEMDLAIARRNVFTREEPWNRTDFLAIAIREKLAKMERCRSRQK